VTVGKHQPIDDQMAAEIRRLHKKYPKLGHHGIAEVLRSEGCEVDPAELEQFMRHNRLNADKPWRPYLRLGLPRWMDPTGGAIRVDSPRKRIRWRLW